METKKGLTRLQGWVIIGLLAVIAGWIGLQVWYDDATYMDPTTVTAPTLAP